MTKVAIVYHSGYGHTTKAAEAVQAGVVAAGAEAELILIDKPHFGRSPGSEGIRFQRPRFSGWRQKRDRARVPAQMP